jgi:serine/threonine protein kinase
MAKVIAVGQPVNESERHAIAYCRDHLPDTYTILHNLEIVDNKDIYEVDMAILAPHCVFLVDIKGTMGLVDIYGSKWYPEGRQPFFSPLAKLRSHARAIKSLIINAHPGNDTLKSVHVHAAVLMTAPDSKVVDHGKLDGPDVVYLNKSLPYFQSKAFIPDHRSQDIASVLGIIQGTLLGTSQKKTGVIAFRQWLTEEKLGQTDRYIEYRARHSLLGKSTGTVRLRFYGVDPYLPKNDRERSLKVISNAYRSVALLPAHPNIISVRDFFPSDDEDGYILVTDDFHGNALRQHINRQDLALTFDQKLRIMQDVLAGLDHAHKNQVVHRNLTPDAILIGLDGQTKITSFDYARYGVSRQSTISAEIIDDIQYDYQPVEVFDEPGKATPQSDLYSSGIIFYELLVGEKPFDSPTHALDCGAIFPVKPSEKRPEFPVALDNWLLKLCALEPGNRYATAAEASQVLADILTDSSSPAIIQKEPEPKPSLVNLPKGYKLGDRFIIQEPLGKPGGFAIVYKVFDTYGEVDRVLKLIIHDKKSVLSRLRQEYKTLMQLPPHKNVVEVIWADRFVELEDTPYIVFAYIDGLTVEELMKSESLSAQDSLLIAQQATEGLIHIHQNGVYHQDIKPSNLFWTDNGVKIIDFNMAATDNDDGALGGTKNYMPPDFNPNVEVSKSEKIDRDLYALAITFYQCLTGQYPFEQPAFIAKSAPRDPRNFAKTRDLNKAWVDFFYKALAPHRANRFSSSEEVLDFLKTLPEPFTRDTTQSRVIQFVLPADVVPVKPNVNPFVSHLLTMYSQSHASNSGTRGLDQVGELTYIPTLLDQELKPSILRGDFRLVIISGNAGDGKTAYIQQLEHAIPPSEKSKVEASENGSIFTLNGRKFITNYDGSQDEGQTTNQEALLKFFSPFQGRESSNWPTNETRIIAINEGKLVDFLSSQGREFPLLIKLVKDGLRGQVSQKDIVIVNLNLRSVVTDLGEETLSIFDRLIRKFTDPQFWQACNQCDLSDKCYIHHNIRTFNDPIAGPKVIQRLKTLYTVTHLRGRLHITLRDLRSSLSYMLVGTRNCDEVHQLYLQGSVAIQDILDGYYFNSWLGGSKGVDDRLVSLMSEIDIGNTSDPELDKSFGFFDPDSREMARFNFDQRGQYDIQLFRKIFDDLPRNRSLASLKNYLQNHRDYVTQLRRRYFFESRDNTRWQKMLPYGYVEQFMRLVSGELDPQQHLPRILSAINRGEGIIDVQNNSAQLALRVTEVEKANIRSYRLFNSAQFSLSRSEIDSMLRFIEYLPQGLLLKYKTPNGITAELTINLDVYEMLELLLAGYIPGVEERQGFYRTLAVFKNILSSAPYQEVLLTETGREFYRIRRDEQGILDLSPVTQGGF